MDLKKLNRGFGDALRSLGLPAGRNHGFTLHSLRHFFETFCINNNIPQRAVDAWLGHGADKSMGSVYYRLTDLDSQEFMKRVPFGADVTDGTGPRDVGSVDS